MRMMRCGHEANIKTMKTIRILLKFLGLSQKPMTAWNHHPNSKCELDQGRICGQMQNVSTGKGQLTLF